MLVVCWLVGLLVGVCCVVCVVFVRRSLCIVCCLLFVVYSVWCAVGCLLVVLFVCLLFVDVRSLLVVCC